MKWKHPNSDEINKDIIKEQIDLVRQPPKDMEDLDRKMGLIDELNRKLLIRAGLDNSLAENFVDGMKATRQAYLAGYKFLKGRSSK